MNTPIETFPNVAFLGGGNMARAMASGLLSKGYANSNVGVWVRDDTRANDWKARLAVNTHTSINTELTNYSVWILSVKPQDLKALCTSLLEPLKGMKGNLPVIISIAAGINVATITQWLSPSDALKVIRVMPNTPAAVGKAISGVYANQLCSDKDKSHTDSLLSTMGKTVWVNDEEQIHAISATSGSGTAYYFYFTECLAQAAVSMGLSPETAQVLARETLIGAGHLAENAQEPLNTLREQVTSKGGTTERALQAFSKALPELVKTAAQSAKSRSQEMSQP